MGNKGKKWYRSRTLWFNILSLLGLLVQSQAGFLSDPEIQAGAIGLVNIGLRAITKEGVTT